MRSERGEAVLELALGFLVIMVPMALIAVSFGPTLERRSFVRSVAAEVARYTVVTDGDEVGAIEVARAMASNSDIDPATVTIALCGGDPSPLSENPASSCVAGTGFLPRGGVVEVTVSAAVPYIVSDRVSAVSHSHTEFVDLYRSR